MKPSTKIQHEVFQMNRNLIDIQSKIETWAFSECNEKVGIATKSKFWCIDCGDEHPISLVKNNKAVCPGCNMELAITKSRKRKFDQSYWVGFAELSQGEIMGDVQIIRLFEFRSYHAVGKKPRIYIQENIRQFIPRNHNKIQYVARKRNMGQGWPCYGDLEIRTISHYNTYVYNPYPFKYHPWSQFKAEYEKLGINKDLQGLTFLSASRILPYDNKAETLLKSKQFSLFSECNNNSTSINQYWPSIKIALRNNYYVTDGGMFLDYLQLLSFFNKDLRSPKYVCPTDLKKEHDRYVKKKQELDRKAKLELQRQKIEKEQLEYEKAKGAYFGIAFTSGDLEVKVLQSVQEFFEQGDIHKHCVFANEYYKKEHALIMAAYKKGQPLETIEINLEKMEVVQARGLQNKASDYNKQILELVNSNIQKIAQLKAS